MTVFEILWIIVAAFTTWIVFDVTCVTLKVTVPALYKLGMALFGAMVAYTVLL